jgi:hypothetical protein
MVWTKSSDGSIVDQNGKIIFSARDVSSTTSASETAASCGAKSEERPSNDEHVFPERLLRPALETILAPMCLIDDDNDVPPIRQHRVGNLAGGAGEFLNSSEDHAAERADAVA